MHLYITQFVIRNREEIYFNSYLSKMHFIFYLTLSITMTSRKEEIKVMKNK